MQLKEFVLYHRSLIDMAERLKKLYSSPFFMEFMLSSLFLCVSAFHVFISEEFYLRQVPIFFHASGVFVDLLIYSYGGQRIMDCSKEICDDCYKMDKNYTLVMARAQREVKIKSLVFTASLPMFTDIMRGTLSMIAAFKSFK